MPKNHDTVRVRIPPSPTGFMHIATARVALLNWVFARQRNGEVILRIEDTDRERSKKEFEDDIMTQLTWLDLVWDKGPLRQSERLDLYRKQAELLKTQGKAYEKEGALYFKVNQEGGDIVFDDLIKGEVRFARKEIPDFVILRKDGTPIYHLTVVVDDIENEITHVIRGEDHLSNTPKHILLFEALGGRVPEFAHLPIILGPDGGKLSKRHGAVSIKDFRSRGYLPEAINNFSALLGWSPLAGQAGEEVVDKKKMVQIFNLERISHHPAIFETGKLDFLNGYYLRQLKLGDLAERLLEWYQYTGKKPPEKGERLLSVLATVQERLKRLDEFPNLTKFYFEEPTYRADLLIFKKSDQRKTKLGLSKALEALKTLRAWSRDEVEGSLAAVVTSQSLGNGDVFWPVRVAVTGEEASPPPVDVLLVLGRDKSLQRIADALGVLGDNGAK